MPRAFMPTSNPSDDLGISLFIRGLPCLFALATVAVSWISTSAIVAVGMRDCRRLVRLDPQAHWTERARLSYTTRLRLGAFLIVFPALFATIAAMTTGPLSLVRPVVTAAVAGVGSFASTFAIARALGRELGFRRTPLAADLRAAMLPLIGVASFVGVLVGSYALGVAFASRSPGHAGAGSVLLVAAVALRSPLLRALGLLVPDATLVSRFAPVFARVGVEPRGMSRLEVETANAYADPIGRRILVTRRLLEVLDEAMLASVVAHEAGHLREGRRAWVRLAPLLVASVGAFVAPSVRPELFPFAISGGFAALLLVWFLVLRVSRTLEREADGHAMSATEAATYARALERIYEANLMPAVMRLGTHPSLYDRMLAASVTPRFPRPELPPRGPVVATTATLFSALVVLLVGAAVPRIMARSERESLAIAASLGGDAYHLGELAILTYGDDDLAGADALYALAEREDPANVWFPANRTFVLVALGRCREARAAAARAMLIDSTAPDERAIAEEARDVARACDAP